MPIIPLTCPYCGGDLQIDSNLEAAVCKFCKKPFVVKDAVFQNYINNITNINAENVNIYTQKDFVIEAGELKEYKGESVDVVIPDNVKYIGWKAFAGKGIETVTMSDNITHIMDNAFEWCSCLKSINISKNVKQISKRAFAECYNLKSITIPDGVTSINDEAFSGCSSLTSVEIPNSVTSIGKGAFQNCISLSGIVIPDSVRSLGEYAFKNCSGMTSLKLSNSLEKIPGGAFLGCEKLESVKIPGSVKFIYNAAYVDGAFTSCSSLSKVEFSEGLEGIDVNAFSNCTKLNSINIPNTVKILSYGAFIDCTSLSSVSCPDELIICTRSSGSSLFKKSYGSPFLNTPFWRQYCNEHNLCYKCGNQLFLSLKCPSCGAKRTFNS